MIKRGIATGLLVTVVWTGQALAWPGRSCMCSGEPPLPPGIGGPGLGGQQIEGLGGTAGRGWVLYHGVWIPPDVAAAMEDTVARVTIETAWAKIKLYKDIAVFVGGVLVVGGVMAAWLSHKLTTAQVRTIFEGFLRKQGWDLRTQ